MNTLLQDIRYALRQLRKSPAFTLTVIVTLALGIGANAAVFTLFDQVLLRMLPVERPKELVRFEWTGGFSGWASSFGGGQGNYFSYPMYKDLRDHNQVFQSMLAADRAGVAVSWRNQAEDKDAEVVSGNYFQVLGLKPALGRLLMPQDDTAKNANPVLVLGYDYWKTRFAASPDVVGQTVLINGHPFTILGVAPENFTSAIGGYKPGVFIPISMADIALPWMNARDNLTNHQSIWLTLVARLKPGVSMSQAEAGLGPLWHSLRAYGHLAESLRTLGCGAGILAERVGKIRVKEMKDRRKAEEQAGDKTNGEGEQKHAPIDGRRVRLFAWVCVGHDAYQCCGHDRRKSKARGCAGDAEQCAL